VKVTRRAPRLTKRPRRQKVKRIKPSGAVPARVFRITPDYRLPYRVEVRLSRTRPQMHREMKRLDAIVEDPMCMGLCRTWSAPRLRQAGAARPGFLLARIYLNVKDLQSRPNEIVSHECAHAAMGWARFRQANLRRMPGEEVMCHALGRLVAQANYQLYAANAFV
jgi:hypothetical protein